MTITTFLNIHHLAVSHHPHWRMVPEDQQRYGEIHGLYRLRGILRATNGIMCFIENPITNEVHEGHLQWFIYDKGEKQQKFRPRARQTATYTFLAELA